MMRWMKTRRRRISVSLSLALVLSGVVTGDVQAGEAKGDSLPVSSPRVSESAPTQWDCVLFGRYWQNDTNKDGKANREDDKEPIRWRVLSVDEEEVFLLADQNLDAMPFDTYTHKGIAWNFSFVRSWLNGYSADNNVAGEDCSADSFLDQAFTEEEQSVIADSLVVNGDNPIDQTKGGKNTRDKVFLLSIDEAMNPAYGFSEQPEAKWEGRVSSQTDYVWDGGTIENSKLHFTEISEAGKNTYWWLRTLGKGGAAWVNGYGAVKGSGISSGEKCISVRPALRMKRSAFEKGLCRYAGFIETDEDCYEFSESEASRKISNPRVSVKEDKVTWDCVWFGDYWQKDTTGDGTADQNDGKQPILWRILEVDGNMATLVSDRILEEKCYHEAHEEVTWENCTLRSWLNGYDASENACGADCRKDNFLTSAFSEKERKSIVPSELENKSVDNQEDGGSNTADQIFCLSYKDMKEWGYGFRSGISMRQARYTDYAARNLKEDKGNPMGLGDWRLRTQGDDHLRTLYVTKEGSLTESFGTKYAMRYVDTNIGVRPALCVDLSRIDSDSFSYAGTVTRYNGGRKKLLDGSEEPEPTAAVSASPKETSVPAASKEPEEMPSPTSSEEPGNAPVPVSNPKSGEYVPSVWDCVWFGHYWQNDTNRDSYVNRRDEKEAIKWRVLSVDEEEILLVADQNLDVMPYDTYGYLGVTWKYSMMRSWLNGYDASTNLVSKDYSADNFLEHAFTEEEQSVIADSMVVNADNPMDHTMGGKNTRDKVFLLSAEEVTNPAYGFSEMQKWKSESRISSHTQFVRKGGTIGNQSITSQLVAGAGKNSYWWLRTPGERGNAWVNSYGEIFYAGEPNSVNNIAVRPALRMKRSAFQKGLCKYAGFVESDEDRYELGKDVADGEVSCPRVNFKAKRATWDCVWFGKYWQNDTTGDGTADQNDEKQPILWRVLDVEDGKALLVSDRNLQKVSYNETNDEVTWDTCTLRSWLNGYDAAANVCGIDYGKDNFLYSAFSQEERNAVIPSELKNKGINGKTDGGKSTIDQIFCLSMDDIDTWEYGFRLGRSLCQSKNTNYADQTGKRQYDTWWSEWWLRTTGSDNKCSVSILEDGYSKSGCLNIGKDVAVRPAMYVDLSKVESEFFSYAGTVTRYNGGRMELLEVSPTPKPTSTPTAPPTVSPTAEATETPTMPPTPEPVETPTVPPIPEATETPTVPPTPEPVETPTVPPILEATETPTVSPTPEPPIDDPLMTKPPEAFVEPPTAEPSETPTGIPTAKPMFPSMGTPSPNPPLGSAQMAHADAFNGRNANLQVAILSIKLSRDNAPVIRWKMNGAADGYQLYRSRKKNTGYRMVQQFSSKKILRFTDKKAGAKKTYYYRIRCYKVTVRGILLGEFSKARRVKTLNLIRPKIKGSKGVTASQIPYITLRLKRYRGTKLSIYYRVGRGKYKRLKLTSSSIKKNHGRFKIQCSKVRRTYYFRVKTSIRRKGRRYYSRYSNVVKIRR